MRSMTLFRALRMSALLPARLALPAVRRALPVARLAVPVAGFALLITVLAALVSPLAAQRVGCTYDACALRVQSPSLLAPAMLVRGAAAEELAPLTPFGETIAQFFERGDSAYAHALRYDRLTPTAGVLNIAGPALLILGPLLTDWRQRPIASFTLLAGGLGMTLYGTHLANTANEALNRAIWWHNRELRP
jgi:hypothetical protein